jgi:hypothetical protein
MKLTFFGKWIVFKSAGIAWLEIDDEGINDNNGCEKMVHAKLRL